MKLIKTQFKTQFKKQFNKPLRDNSGFTLVEVLVSMLILSVIVSSVLTSFIYASRITKENKLKMTALNLANQRVEFIRSLEFAKVGTMTKDIDGSIIYGDPKGDIMQTETQTVNNIVYTVNTSINWEEEGGWSATDADWDYKSVTVSVVPESSYDDAALTQTIQTYVARDGSQPALVGSNIKVRTLRGWNTGVGTVIPAVGIKVRLATGPSAVRQVMTSATGAARFLDLTAGNYSVLVDPSNIGMILLPNQAALWDDVDVALSSTESKEFYVEYPCSINIMLKNLSGTPFSIDEGATGKITLWAPYPSGTVLHRDFGAADIDASGNMPLNVFTNLWPVGDGYAGMYTISGAIDSYLYYGCCEGVGSSETEWSGKFDGPGTAKQLVCYFEKFPVTPADINTAWVDDDGRIIGGAIALNEDGDRVLNGKFGTDDPNETIIVPDDCDCVFNAAEIYFDNTGDASNPGLSIGRHSDLNLRTGTVVFNCVIKFNGTITLNTSYEEGCVEEEAPSVDGSLIGGTAGVKYGKLYLLQPVTAGETTIEQGAYYYKDGTVLPNDAGDLIKINKFNLIN